MNRNYQKEQKVIIEKESRPSRQNLLNTPQKTKLGPLSSLQRLKESCSSTLSTEEYDCFRINQKVKIKLKQETCPREQDVSKSIAGSLETLQRLKDSSSSITTSKEYGDYFCSNQKIKIKQNVPKANRGSLESLQCFIRSSSNLSSLGQYDLCFRSRRKEQEINSEEEICVISQECTVPLRDSDGSKRKDSSSSSTEDGGYPMNYMNNKVLKRILLPQKSALLAKDKKKLKKAYETYEVCRLKPYTPKWYECLPYQRYRKYSPPRNFGQKQIDEACVPKVDKSACSSDDLFSEVGVSELEDEEICSEPTKLILESEAATAETEIVLVETKNSNDAVEPHLQLPYSVPLTNLHASPTMLDLTAEIYNEPAEVSNSIDSHAQPNVPEKLPPTKEVEQPKPKSTVKSKHPLQLDYISFITADPKALSTIGLFNNRGQITKEAAKKLKEVKARTVVGKNFPFRQPRQTPMPELPPKTSSLPQNKCLNHQQQENWSSSSSGLSDSWFVRS